MAAPRSRYKGLMPPHLMLKNSPITIIGVGGIGSVAAEALGRIGFGLSIYDPDTVGRENIGSQAFGFGDLDKPKVDVLKSRIESSYRVKVDAHQELFTGQTELAGIIIAGVDSKETRAEIWDKAIEYNPNIPLYLDGRVGADRFKLFALNPCDPGQIEKYKSHLDLTQKAMATVCTERFAPEAGLALQNYIWLAVKHYVLNKKVPFMVAGNNYTVRIVW